MVVARAKARIGVRRHRADLDAGEGDMIADEPGSGVEIKTGLPLTASRSS